MEASGQFRTPAALHGENSGTTLSRKQDGYQNRYGRLTLEENPLSLWEIESQIVDYVS